MIANSDRHRENDKRWKANNKERVKKIQKKSYDKHGDKIRAYMRERYQENRESLSAKSRQSYHQNKESARERNIRWRRENPDRVRAIKLNRRARLKNAGGTISHEEIAQIIERQKGRCVHCKAATKLEMDHIIPLAKGGSNDRRNFQGLCRPCNLSKKDKHPIEFARLAGLLL